MKKTLLGLLCALGSLAYAQDNYFSFHAGYGIGLPGTTGYEQTGDTSAAIVNSKPLRLAGGINVGASFGILTRDNWGLDLGINYQNQFGQKFESVSTQLTVDENFNPILVENTSVQTFKGYSIRFTPALRIQADSRDVNPYLSIGPSIVYSAFSSTTETTAGSNSNIVKENFSNTISFGGVATLGMEFEIDRDLFFFGALQYAGGYVTPSRSEITQAEVNGESMLDDMTTADKETEYVDPYTQTLNFGQDPDNQPTKAPRQTLSYNALNILVGIRIQL